MALSRRSGRSRLTLALLVLTSITVLTLDFRGSGMVDGVRSAAGTAFDPIRNGASAVFRPVANVWNGIFDYGHIKSENDKLKDRVAQLEGQKVTEADAEAQLAQIAATEGLPITAQIPTVLARVVGGAASNFEHTIDLSKGTDANLQVGMPVVTGAGLVGRIVAVTRTRSTVQLITDPAFDMGVRLVASGTVGIAHGRGEGHDLAAEILDPKLAVAPNEAVTTSDYASSIFPPDIPVGVVMSAELTSDQRGQDLDVRPMVDISDLAYVRVIVWMPTP
jgi:rod shape-determining protein MreC